MQALEMPCFKIPDKQIHMLDSEKLSNLAGKVIKQEILVFSVINQDCCFMYLEKHKIQFV